MLPSQPLEAQYPGNAVGHGPEDCRRANPVPIDCPHTTVAAPALSTRCSKAPSRITSPWFFCSSHRPLTNYPQTLNLAASRERTNLASCSSQARPHETTCCYQRYVCYLISSSYPCRERRELEPPQLEIPKFTKASISRVQIGSFSACLHHPFSASQSRSLPPSIPSRVSCSSPLPFSVSSQRVPRLQDQNNTLSKARRYNSDNRTRVDLGAEPLVLARQT